MAQLAAGQLRLTIRRRNGDRVASTKAVNYTIADNEATPRWAINEPGATANDQGSFFDHLVHGGAGEYLTLDFYHTASATMDASAHVVRIGIERISRDPVSGKKLTDDDQLTIGQRMTLSTAGTINDPRGIKVDDAVTVANEWTPILAWGFGAAENIRLSGFQYAVLDGA